MIEVKEEDLFKNLRIDCSKCYGFCCVALYFSKSDGFPKDKVAGCPCENLKEDFSCEIHKDLRNKGLKGCTTYDCFGAGQKVANTIYKDNTWHDDNKLAEEMFDVFVIIRQLHEMLWYLNESLLVTHNKILKNKLIEMIDTTEGLTNLDGKSILEIDVDSHRIKVNELLKVVSEKVRIEFIESNKHKSNKKILKRGFDFIGIDLSKSNLIGANLAGTLLIASNLSSTDLKGAILIGADMRDANIKGANLEKTMFLTQSQINSAIGDHRTKLPKQLRRPSYWN